MTCDDCGMRVFYDCEFLENGSTIDLISIGMVCDDGREYYAVNSDMPVDRIRSHQWLMANVVPHLPLAGGKISKSTGDNTAPYGRFDLDRDRTEVKPRRVIANEVRDFLQATPKLELWSWYGAYDHVCLAQLWGPMVRLPKGIPMWTNDLQQLAEHIGDETIPGRPEGDHEHNALADARYHQLIHDSLTRDTLYPSSLIDHLEAAWGVIANSGVFGNPAEPSPGALEAAEAWRDRYHAILDTWVRRTARNQT